jgi:shikimate 5-dehydrogenase
MIQLGLIGYPVSPSLSPKIQNAALKACGLEGEYSLYPIAPDDMQGLKDLLVRVRLGEITGLNVTIPHKQNVIPFMDELTPTGHPGFSSSNCPSGKNDRIRTAENWPVCQCRCR